MDIESLRREIRALRVLVSCLVLLTAVVLVAATGASRNASFDKITVHRLDLVDDDGTLRLAIANKQNFPPLIMHGKPYGAGMRSIGGAASIFYYNSLGDEQGGFFWDGFRKGDAYEQYTSMTSDQFEGDNDMVLSFDDSTGKHNGGLMIGNQKQTTPLDELDKQLQAELAKARTPEERKAIDRAFTRAHYGTIQRLFAGYSEQEGAEVKLSDKEGRKRIQMVVDDAGNPKLVFLDADGKVIYQLPDAAARR